MCQRYRATKSARLKGRADDLGRRSPNLSLFNERSRVILGQVLCRDDTLDAIPGDERDGAATDRIKHAGLIRTIAEILPHAVVTSEPTNSSRFLLPFGFESLAARLLPPTGIYCADCNLKKLLEETASSGGKTISPSTNSTDQSL